MHIEAGVSWHIDCYDNVIMKGSIALNLSAQTPQNGQTHSSNSSVPANELFKCVGPFCWVAAEKAKSTTSL